MATNFPDRVIQYPTNTFLTGKGDQVFKALLKASKVGNYPNFKKYAVINDRHQNRTALGFSWVPLYGIVSWVTYALCHFEAIRDIIPPSLQVVKFSV